ncbi:cyclase family protein [Caenimonas aquaedulcis]|uniref:Cyclase family protein n=1 Tax=Caenimonas aquaedulcis TaxID=2793270 RepID=A0A931MGD9_9BURK|nr:cyclase family protein [Caenimonas aquaedulcis]MBG9387963.1 cyclase family protein [Caenimonas aquaedulcis]
MSAAQPRRWVRRPDGSNWGDFGDDDRLGRLNLITPERRRAALAEAREGLVFCLSLPLDVGPGMNPSRFPPKLAPAIRDGRPRYNACACVVYPGLTDVVCDDKVELWTQYSTQWDSLVHHGSLFDADGDGVEEIRYYNGFGEVEAVGTSPLGIQHMAETCVQGRGVLIDLWKHAGAAKTVIGYDQLMRIMEADRVVVEAGDLLCLRTGFADQLLLDKRPDAQALNDFGATLDGRDARLMQWITDSGISALIADNVAVEARASAPKPGFLGSSMPLHDHCLFKLGLHLGELFLLSPLADWLAANARNRFLLTAPPLRLPGAVGSPATPVATV